MLPTKIWISRVFIMPIVLNWTLQSGDESEEILEEESTNFKNKEFLTQSRYDFFTDDDTIVSQIILMASLALINFSRAQTM